MSSTLPAETEAELRREFSRGIDQLRDGKFMPIGGLVIYRDLREKRFVVCCYSTMYYSQNITRQEAEERIVTAKEELATLVGLFPELRDEMRDLDLSFQFCYDTGKAGVCIAKEEHGHIQYFTPVA